jgi:hypothetical protein
VRHDLGHPYAHEESDLSHAEHEPVVEDHPTPDSEGPAEPKLEDLAPRDEQAAEVAGGNHPLSVGWNRVRNLPGGG